ncbi:MAG: prenyltransferase/squalene oxidase repeat-containing protein, partial [Limisphaerales bacterium]
TSPTAAAVAVLTNLGMPVADTVGDWLMSQAHKLGGFTASSDTPLPDLLSTATALHALACLERDISPVREQCLDFVDSLWTNEGGFYGHWSDDHLDCEYTYYGLLALGHLAV